MRIVIEIDGKEATPLSWNASGQDATVSAESAGDGGPGPDAGTSGAPDANAAVLTDSGPPPDWLLEAVAAAEAEGRSSASPERAGAVEQHGDAGPGPGG